MHNPRPLAYLALGASMVLVGSYVALTKPRERAEITFDKNAINIHVYLAAEQREDVLKRRRRTENEDVVQRALDAFESGDPFAESDLPVDHITENQKKAE